MSRYVVLFDIETKTWVEEGSANAFYEHLLFRYHTEKSKKSLHMVKGQFSSSPQVPTQSPPLSSHSGANRHEQPRVNQPQTQYANPLFPRPIPGAHSATHPSTRHGDVSVEETAAETVSRQASQEERLKAHGYVPIVSARRTHKSDTFEYNGRKISGWESKTVDGKACYICQDKKIWVLKNDVR